MVRNTGLTFIVCLLVVVFIGVAAYLRIALPYKQIFANADIMFAGSDAT